MDNLKTSKIYDFSVIMAVYNVEVYLRQAIDSVISQTFGFEKIQIILVDDGSSDKSGEICDEYVGNYPDNIMVIHKENGGVASARNEGLKYATGKYINFLDSDDCFSENTFQSVFDFFNKNEDLTDIVTIPLEFFDAKTGAHWQNDKFKDGSRIIDLYTNYEATLMFVNASFFHNRVKEKINFDGRLVCGEDQKVILYILSDKMTVGVVDNCKYMYRRRSEEGSPSIIQGMKGKYSWYFDYFTYLIDWAVDFYNEKFGFIPAFVQYQLLSDLQWRYDVDYDLSLVLSAEDIVAYKERLSKTLRYFDDKYLMEQKMIWGEQKCYMLSQKYNSPPTLTPRNNDLLIHFGNTIVNCLSSQSVIFKEISIKNGRLYIEGVAKLMGIPKEEQINVIFKDNNRLLTCEVLWDKCEYDYRFSDLILSSISFCANVPLSKNVKEYTFRTFFQYKDSLIPKKKIRFAKKCVITSENPTVFFEEEEWEVKTDMTSIKIRHKEKPVPIETVSNDLSTTQPDSGDSEVQKVTQNNKEVSNNVKQKSRLFGWFKSNK